MVHYEVLRVECENPNSKIYEGNGEFSFRLKTIFIKVGFRDLNDYRVAVCNWFRDYVDPINKCLKSAPLGWRLRTSGPFPILPVRPIDTKFHATMKLNDCKQFFPDDIYELNSSEDEEEQEESVYDVLLIVRFHSLEALRRHKKTNFRMIQKQLNLIEFVYEDTRRHPVTHDAIDIHVYK